MKMLLVLCMLLAGCASMNTPKLDPAQLQAVQQQDFAAVCATVSGAWGQGKLVYAKVDKSVIINGDVTVTADCVLTMSNTSMPMTKTTTINHFPAKP